MARGGGVVARLAGLLGARGRELRETRWSLAARAVARSAHSGSVST
ncbi:hypothetical protein DB32_002325 [Sandaracinus amylolyticus]|uniref:Uncharacterized protein n=1 Tax=Sandaracinus amylolyticus TaxID=927083 RepID=A0A0F6YII9_9BACT|nr:hypothetical protein DB32_002325 [Sandaracinus amylolyticus]